eukprot:4626100-Pyramimonas_sp.AAC.1
MPFWSVRGAVWGSSWGPLGTLLGSFWGSAAALEPHWGLTAPVGSEKARNAKHIDPPSVLESSWPLGGVPRGFEGRLD